MSEYPGALKDSWRHHEEGHSRFVCTPVRNIVQLLPVVEVLAINRFVQSHHGFNQVRDDRNSANHTREEVIR